MMSLNTFRAKAILIDITGVLYESGTDCAIAGSIDAIRKLRQSRLPFKFVTNETQNTTSGLASKLNRFGFDVTPDEIFAPAPAVRRYLNEHGLRPHYLIHPGVEAEFEGIRSIIRT
ncbi:Phospholysine phosphohistidine inorganic pyrophosphate phosphatase [Halotydeus destructor]|nr:Phospholysine phosphohistidine inorganic pyrophosphate phosphatase [Halotydeus destructor]